MNRRKRLSWCREKRKLTVENYWKKVIFLDESKIVVGQDSRVYVWRKRGEGWRPNFGEGAENQAMLRSDGLGMSHMHRVGTISAVDGNINAYKYQQILDDNLWSVLAHHFPTGNYVFQDDNAPVQSARSTQDYLHRNSIRTMSWPAHSPDINIIENI